MKEIAQEITFILKEMVEVLRPSLLDWFTFGIALVTLFLLWRYVYHTKKIAISAEKTLRESLRPSISWELMSGINYFSSNVLKQNPTWITDTRFRVRNHSRHNVTVYVNVNLNLKIDGKSETYNDLYSDQTPWPLYPFQGINGHFNLGNKFNLQNAHKIEIEIELQYNSEGGEVYKIPKQHWIYDKSGNEWRNDIGMVV